MVSKTIKDVIKGGESITKDVKDIQEDRFALKRMSEKVAKLVGDKYVSILFDIKYPPQIGDSIKVGNLVAIFRKIK